MKQFSKIVFASMMGTFMALGFLFFVVLAMIAGVAGNSSKSEGWDPEIGKISDQSILLIRFDGPLKDHVKKRNFFSALMNYNEPPVTGLYELSEVLKKAAGDERIKGVALRFDGLVTGMANGEALRRELIKFKESGKFLISYSEVYGEKDYLIASAADEVILYPKGYFEWDGVFTKLSYLKNTMKKLDVVPQVFRVGKYKSAIEPFIEDKMSEASREQVGALLDGSWKQLLKYASEKTKLSEDELNDLAENMSVLYAKDALEKGFVTQLASVEEVEEKFKELTGVEDKPKYVGWRAYHKELKENEASQRDSRVAVVFAEGGISTEDEEGDGISSKTLTQILHKIRDEEKVKAVVIRVNSPGGSALASDVIWTATQWLKDSKPVVTSFGNVAASGGYYMSAGSHYILAEPSTITGSIGVFGLSFATQKFWNDNVGMTFDTMKTHRFSDMESLVRPLEPEEGTKMQGMVDQIYEDFLNVVVNGRTSFDTRDKAHEVAQGRVWIGTTAKEIGLVDELGGMDRAIEKAAELAQLSDYSVEVYPKELSPLQEFMKQLGEVSIQIAVAWIPDSLKTLVKHNEPQSLHERVLTRMPFDINIQ